MNGCYALFRLPGETSYTSVKSSRAVELVGLENLAATSGFVIAPFTRNSVTPLLFIPADEHSAKVLPLETNSLQANLSDSPTTPDNSYIQAFERFHSVVQSGKFNKLVLSRSRSVKLDTDADPYHIFIDTCLHYPDMMVVLFSTPQSGTWIVCTPEPLLEYDGGRYHTVALAGTMLSGEGGWSEKNIQEQHLVESFVVNAVSEFADEMKVSGPYTTDAGALKHLKTDVTFEAAESKLGNILMKLHPTPAVCGLPQKAAREFILDNEQHDRKYYSGFSGPVNIDGRSSLYVSLRCAQLDMDNNAAILYAGGGIMPESECCAEFEETENKMQTISLCLATKKM